MLNYGNLVGLNQKYHSFRLKYSTILYTNTETMLVELKSQTKMCLTFLYKGQSVSHPDEVHHNVAQISTSHLS